MIEAVRKRPFDVERAAETHAAEEREPVAALEQQSDHLEEILVPAHGDAVLGDAAEAGHHTIVERLGERRCVEDWRERPTLASGRDSRQRGGQRLDLEPVDADDRVAVVHQVVRQREAGRSHADDERALGRRGARRRPAQVERVPAREQRIDLETPGQRQHVLQDPRFRLRNVDRVGLLIDARLHAVVADSVASTGDERIVDADDRQRGKRQAVGA